MRELIGRYIDHFAAGRVLLEADAETLLDQMIDGGDDKLLSELFPAWNKKGIAENEIFYFARVMRQRMARVKARHKTFVDIVGTGGSGAKRFNVSTAAAFVVAGAGVPVAKHGNKAATSMSGSSDVLSELGISPGGRDAAERSLNELGICFMFAPDHHRLSSQLAQVRRCLGFPTIFNCVGPLCNPASAQHQVIGVWHEGLVPKMAGALARLGTSRSWVVHGRDGLDEVSMSGATYVAEVTGEKVREFEIAPADLGLDVEPAEQQRPITAPESAAIIRSVLNGEPGPEADLVIANAAVAIHLTGNAGSLQEGTRMARESIRSGNARRKLNALAGRDHEVTA